MGFSEFTRERQFLSNVSPSTLEWYKHSFKWLDTESPSQEDLKAAVVRMREKGLKATGCNSAIRAINTYVHWANAGSEVKCGPTCKHPKIAQLKEPQLVLPTFTEQQIRLLVAWKPKDKYQERLHLLTLFLLDTGCRISEALTLRVTEINLENLLVTLDGKGRKQRVVPLVLSYGKQWCGTARNRIVRETICSLPTAPKRNWDEGTSCGTLNYYAGGLDSPLRAAPSTPSGTLSL